MGSVRGVQSANPIEFMRIRPLRLSKHKVPERLQNANPREFTRIRFQGPICIQIHVSMFVCLYVCAFVCRASPPANPQSTPSPYRPQKAPKPSNLNKNWILQNPSSHFPVFRAAGIVPRPPRDHHQATTRPPKWSSRAQTLLNSRGLGPLDLQKIELQSRNPREVTRIGLLRPLRNEAPEHRSSCFHEERAP